MKNLKKVLSILLVCAMIVPMCMFQVSADTPKLTNWSTMAAKYAMDSGSIIAPSSKNFEITTKGFTFTETEEGSIFAHVPNNAETAGVYAASAMMSDAPTELDGLTVVIQPNELFDFTIDNNGASNMFSVLWTEDRIEGIAGFNETTRKYDMGLCNLTVAGTNGLRHLIPVARDARLGTPANMADESEITGKALCINVSNSYSAYVGSQVASTVSVIYYDGHYINQNDSHPGYRWTFTARNNIGQTANGDNSGISRRFEEIDISNGLTVKVKAHETLGYIVNINGKDYYSGKAVGYFPDARQTDGTSVLLTAEDYVERTQNYKDSMTNAKADIDLTGLTTVDKGYLTVGVVSINDYGLPNHTADYALSYVNTVPAAQWAGEAWPADHECAYEVVSVTDSTCTEDGATVYRCSCGASYSDRIAAKGHDMAVVEENTFAPTCVKTGLTTETCTRCGETTRTSVAALGHAYDDWYVETPATPDADGVKAMVCLRCEDKQTKSYTYSNLDALSTDWEISSENLIWQAFHPEVEHIVDAAYNEDGSLTVKDYSAMTDKNRTYASVTKAISKHKVSLNMFEMTFTPEPLNSANPDKYADNITIMFCTDYNLYNVAAEHSMGSKRDISGFNGVPASEYFTYGMLYKREVEDEYSMSLTLMDWASAQGGYYKFGVDDDCYDAVQWNVRSDGAHWASKTLTLLEPIKMGDEINFFLSYEDSGMGFYSVYFGFNGDFMNWEGNVYVMDGINGGQLVGQDYYLSMAAQSHSVVEDTIDESIGIVGGLSPSSFTINTICGKTAEEFDGYYVEHICSDPEWLGWKTVTPANCSTEGMKVKECAGCGEVVATETIPVNPDIHKMEYVILKEATCTEPGERQKQCSYGCGKTEKIKSIDPTGHSYEWVVTTEATCTEAGEEAYKCAGCGDVTETRPVEAKDHNYEWVVTTEATCTEAGEEANTCTNCGDVSETRPVDVKAHTPSEEYVPVVENGNWDGTEVSYCQVCGELADTRKADLNEIVGAFTDVAEGAWYIGGIAYCTYKGYMTGTTATTAAPDATLTRAQFVTLLAKLDGADLDQYAEVENDFVDVNKGQWFYNAVTWAATEGYANGVGGGKFDPDANVTRAQLAKFFYVYSEKNGGDMTPTNDLSDFSDGTTVPGWAVDYIKWAVGSGLIAGMSGAVNGDGFATRAQAAKIFMVFDNL